MELSCPLEVEAVEGAAVAVVFSFVAASFFPLIFHIPSFRYHVYYKSVSQPLFVRYPPIFLTIKINTHNASFN
jgi:hypothetical protein